MKCWRCSQQAEGGYKSCSRCRKHERERYAKIPKEKKRKRSSTPAQKANSRLQAKKKQRIKHDMVFDHYGRVCVRCGNKDIDVLTIDHIDNQGSKHRDKIGNSGLYGWIIKNNFPSGFQVLCRNCNWKKHLAYIRQQGGYAKYD